MSELRNRARELYQQFPEDWHRRFMIESLRADNSRELSDIIEEIILEYSEPIIPLHTVSRKDVARPRPWYLGPKQQDGHWPLFRKYMETNLQWGEDVITSVDQSSTEITSFLGDPLQSQDYGTKGLVLGYVQSGKTANMAAVITKAVDAGYNTVIVLAGLTNSLRKQTQTRLEDDVCERIPGLWDFYTTSEADLRSDRTRQLRKYSISGRSGVNFLVVKKNVSPLNNLLKLIRQTLKSHRQELRVLVIDDECDQASVNSASKEGDITKINQKIREILKELYKVTYLGYTATPFANVLINPYANEEQLDDLYPKDFITSLPRPEAYFGAEKMFGRASTVADEETDEDTGLNIWRSVTQEESKHFKLGKNRTEDDVEGIPEALKDAIDYFLLTCAARNLRGQTEKHKSMLVHTSHTVNEHELVRERINSYLCEKYGGKRSENDDLDGDPLYEYSTSSINQAQKDRLEQIWRREAVICEGIRGKSVESFKDLYAELPNVLSELTLKKENGADGARRLDYKNGVVTDIVVGGTILARGLTIEGLCVSFFVRSSTQYDALLQMGRWFGYRIGYEDLPRLYTTKLLMNRYRDLADVEAEIRESIEQYRDDEAVSPMDVAVRIRQLPGMLITRSSAMRSAIKRKTSYWGTRQQCIKFHHKDDAGKKEIQNNWDTAAQLVNRCMAMGERKAGDKVVWRNVPLEAIKNFASKYRVYDQRNFNPKMFHDFLIKAEHTGKLDHWTVAIVQPGKGKESEKELGDFGKIKLNNRAQTRDAPEDGVANIRALMSGNDVFYDLDEQPVAKKWDELVEERNAIEGAQPLLLIYGIDKDSEYRGSSKPKDKADRVAMDAEGDLIGLGVVFNGSAQEAHTWIEVDLEGDAAANEAEEEQEEAGAILDRENQEANN